jgi:hypothetical protein
MATRTQKHPASRFRFYIYMRKGVCSSNILLPLTKLYGVTTQTTTIWSTTFSFNLACYLLHAGFMSWLALELWRCRPHIPLKHRMTFNRLTPWSWALLEKPPVAQPLKNFPNILWNTKVHYRVHKSPPTGPYPEPDQSSPYHPILSL